MPVSRRKQSKEEFKKVCDKYAFAETEEARKALEEYVYRYWIEEDQRYFEDFKKANVINFGVLVPYWGTAEIDRASYLLNPERWKDLPEFEYDLEPLKRILEEALCQFKKESLPNKPLSIFADIIFEVFQRALEEEKGKPVKYQNFTARSVIPDFLKHLTAQRKKLKQSEKKTGKREKSISVAFKNIVPDRLAKHLTNAREGGFFSESDYLPLYSLFHGRLTTVRTFDFLGGSYNTLVTMFLEFMEKDRLVIRENGKQLNEKKSKVELKRWIVSNFTHNGEKLSAENVRLIIADKKRRPKIDKDNYINISEFYSGIDILM
jgi:hypothetical protein